MMIRSERETARLRRMLTAAGFDGTVRVYDLSGKMEQDFIPVPLEKAVVSKK